MKINMLVQFLALIDELNGHEETAVEFEHLLKLCGFDYYGLIRNPKPHETMANLMLAGRWPPDWLETYHRKRYLTIDPTMRYLGHAKAGFRWRDTVRAFRGSPDRKRMERMMVHARRNGLEDGYIFPVHGRRGLLGNLVVGGKPVDLHPAEMGLLDSIANRLFWKLLHLSQPPAEMMPPAISGVALTRREMETLNLLADGMTSNEIGRVLKISSHTVDWYMNGLQEKLQAKNRHHVIATAFRLGLIS